MAVVNLLSSAYIFLPLEASQSESPNQASESDIKEQPENGEAPLVLSAPLLLLMVPAAIDYLSDQ